MGQLLAEKQAELDRLGIIHQQRVQGEVLEEEEGSRKNLGKRVRYGCRKRLL